MVVERHAEAVSVLSDSRHIPPPVSDDSSEHTLQWLRAHVCRFSSGATHAERRQLVERRLAAIDPAQLRARARTTADLAPDAVPTAVLGDALGLKDPVDLVPHVRAAATGYLSGEVSPEADAGTAALLRVVDVTDATLLLQAHKATSDLIFAAMRRDGGEVPVDDLLHETLRFDAPVPAIRRVGVTVDVAAANRDPDVFADPDVFRSSRGRSPYLTFGYGIRPCPAPEHALAIAAGYLEGSRAT